MDASKQNGGYFEAYWPRGEMQQKAMRLAPRLDDLNGKTVAQLWDELYKGDQVFTLLEEGLKARYPDIRFVSWREFGSTHGAGERDALARLPQRLRELGVDAVISGMAC
ncbi:hypothetical protein AKI39_12020 [Bordetella sp. H567]|nr:hypothetical protein [Bordetella sp. H567]AOB31266.1 hypothetical protein AKI39_12020 [Bordetella sp. H567]